MDELVPELPHAFAYEHHSHAERNFSQLGTSGALGQQLRFELEIGEGAEMARHPSRIGFAASFPRSPAKMPPRLEGPLLEHRSGIDPDRLHFPADIRMPRATRV